MSITAPAPLDELETSNLASFWAGVRAGARMAPAIDAEGMAADSLAGLVGPGLAAELARVVTEVLLRGESGPRPQADPAPPTRIVPPRPGARPGGAR